MLFLVPVIGGRRYMITQLAIYTTQLAIYILPIYQVLYCQLSDYMLPTTYCGNQEIPLINALGILKGGGCPQREFPKVTGSPYGFSMIP